MHTRRGRGFTLIELLVVIAIIAILAAIFVPVLLTAKAKSRQASCANNIRQVVIALTSYADDNNGRLPGLNVFGDLVDGRFALSHNRWVTLGKGALWNYVRTKAIFVCPEDIQHRKSFDLKSPTSLGGFKYTYTMNSYMTIAYENRTLADFKGELVGKSRNWSRTILIVDENTDPTKGESTVNDVHFANSDRACDRHPGSHSRRVYSTKLLYVSGTANVGYLDGHTGVVPGLVRRDDDIGRTLFWR